MISDQNKARNSFWIAWVLLSAGLIATIIATIHAKMDDEANAKIEFDFGCSQIELRIDSRMTAHAQILLSAAAFFNASDEVTRDKWQLFTWRQKVDQHLPGIQGIGFSLVIPRGRLAQHIQDIRSQGYPDYNVKPEGDREIYTSIIYLEPFSGRNLRAFGYDMFSEPVRRKAMERAMNLDAPALSGKVILVQETDHDVQAGTLMYVPVYRKGMSTDTAEQRSAALYGWVYSPYRMKDLMKGILRGWDAGAGKRIRLQIFDNEQLLADSLLYDSQSKEEMETSSTSRLTLQTSTAFNDHLWYLRFTEVGGQLNYGRVYGILSGGAIISILLFGLFMSLLNTRFRAQHLADQLTVDIIVREESYRNQFANNSTAMMLIDSVGGAIVDANAAALSFYGYTREQLLTMRITDINILPASEVRQTLSAILPKDGKRYEIQHRLADGSLKDVAVSASMIQYGGRSILHTIIQDITERKQAEELLRQATDRLTLAVRAGGVGIWDYDVVNNKLVWDEQMFRLYGITPNQFGGAYEAWLAGVHPEDRLTSDKELQCALRGEKDFDTEFRVVWPDETIHNIRASALVQRDTSGHPLHVIGTNWDITAHKLAENALRESEANFRKRSAAVEQSPVSIVIADTTGAIEYVNPKFTETTGYTFAEVVGHNSRILKSGAFPLEAYKELWNTILAGRIWQGEFHNKKKNGELFWEHASISPIRDDHGVITSFVAVKEDITERKRAEAELHKMNLYLEETTALSNSLAVKAEMASAAKSEFLANMSHEIRTPMNGVIGMTGLLLDTDLNDEQRRYAEIVRDSGESLLKLLNDILDFTKIEAKKLDLETLDFDLSNLLEDFAVSLAVSAHEKGLELLCAADMNVPTLLSGDIGRLRQILTNLVGNAIKFTSAGEVAVRVSRVEDDGAAGRVQGAGGRETVLLRFSVRDTGIGIPKDKIGLLFEVFSQVDASSTRKYGGTGLGLAISKQLVELMGGDVGVNSEDGTGSEFWFTARLAKQAGGVHTESIPITDLQGVRVLIVDDSATNREILIARMESWGMRPMDVQNGPAALRALYLAMDDNDPFRIAVIDMHMPGMDGDAVGRAIKVDKRLAEIQMVMLTTMVMHGDVLNYQDAGFAAYTTKPIRYQELKSVMSMVLADSDGMKPTDMDAAEQPPVAIRHTNSETMNLFADYKARILLAEDNITNQLVAQGILKKLGLRADAVANGAEAIRALETLPYDLVLMDVQMPEMDGIEATKTIRSYELRIRNEKAAVEGGVHPLPAIPIIAMTAHAMQGDRERCLAVGMNDYITKPVTPTALADVLDKWLPKENDESRMLKHKEKIDEVGCLSSLITDNSPLAARRSPLIFDREGMLARLMDDEDLAKMVAESFLEDIPLQIDALKGYLEAGDAAGAERQAHTIKGASANVGGERLRAVAFEMEKAAKAGELRAAGGYITELEAQFAALNKVMTKELLKQ